MNWYKGVLPDIWYLAVCFCFAAFKKIDCNSCMDLISERDNVEKIPEIAIFRGFNRGFLLCHNDITTNTV